MLAGIYASQMMMGGSGLPEPVLGWFALQDGYFGDFGGGVWDIVWFGGYWYMAKSNNRAYRSTDGVTWSDLGISTSSFAFAKFAIGDGVLVLVDYAIAYRTTDGVTFATTPLIGTSYPAMPVGATYCGAGVWVVFNVYNAYECLRSTDNALTFTPFAIPFGRPNADDHKTRRTLSNGAGLLLTCGDPLFDVFGLARSTDYGETFTEIFHDGAPIRKFMLARSDTGRIIATGPNDYYFYEPYDPAKTVMISDDDGLTWAYKVIAGIGSGRPYLIMYTGANCWLLIVDREVGEYPKSGDSYFSDDNGDSWTPLPDVFLGQPPERDSEYTCGYAHSGTVMVGASNNGTMCMNYARGRPLA